MVQWHNYINFYKCVVLKVIPQTIVESVSPVVLENYSLQFWTKDFSLDYVKSLDILHKCQIGFLANNGTADHVLTLRTFKLIDKSVHGYQTKVYACFVDFRKVFYSVWHDGLLYKLSQYNVGGKFFSLIKSLYACKFYVLRKARK